MSKIQLKEANAFQLQNEIKGELSTLVQLEEILEGEFEITPELTATFLQSSSSAFEIVDIINDKLIEEEIKEAGVRAVIEKLSPRLVRAKKRIAALKDCVALVFEAAKLEKIERDSYTIFKRKNPQKLLITDKSKLSDYITVKMVESLDEEMLKAQLKANKIHLESKAELETILVEHEAAKQEFAEQPDKGRELKVARLEAKINKLEKLIELNPYKEIEGAELEEARYSLAFKRG